MHPSVFSNPKELEYRRLSERATLSIVHPLTEAEATMIVRRAVLRCKQIGSNCNQIAGRPDGLGSRNHPRRKSRAMHPMNHSKIVIAALAAVATIPATAHAQSATAQAETLFRQGQDLITKGKFAEACAAFDASQKLEPAIATLLNQASCRE